ncbi:MAG: 50S ribosomal protein L19e [Candidatus Woesearchaeota archaeon]|jgi:large subunit ribosomal protein L19e
MINKKLLASKVMKTSPKKVKFVAESLEEIKKALTRSDIRGLIAVGKIYKRPGNGHSLARARKISAQKRKGRRMGQGSKKGKKYAIITRKEQWMNRVRTQRELIQELKEKGLITSKNYQMLYLRVKGGFFRNKRHLKLYLNEYKLLEKK